MDHSSSTKFSSFVIRFIEEQAGDTATASTYRGMIRHVQTDDEITFADWRAAERFIRRFVPLDTMTDSQEA